MQTIKYVRTEGSVSFALNVVGDDASCWLGLLHTMLLDNLGSLLTLFCALNKLNICIGN